MRGIRARLTVTLVALVALTAVLLGAGAYLFVENSLRTQVVERRRGTGALRPVGDHPGRGTSRGPDRSRTSSTAACARRSAQRGVETIVDLGRRRASSSRPRISRASSNGSRRDVRARVDAGELAYAWTTVAGPPEPRRRRPGTAAAGRASTSSTTCTELRSALGQLRLALVVGTLALIVVALLVARVIARGVLAPVEAAGRAAERIERGDLAPGCRSPRTTSSGHGPSASTGWRRRWPTRSPGSSPPRRRTAASSPTCRTSCAPRSRRSSPRPRSCATTSTRLPPESRRAGELLVADVGRLRTLRRRPDGAVAVRRRRRADRARAGRPRARSCGWSPPPACREASLVAARRAARRRHRPTPPRADRRQPARQRPRACAGRAGRDQPGQPVADEIVAGRRRPGSGHPARPARRASSSGSPRPTRRATAGAAGSGWRSRPSTPRCSAGTSSRRTGERGGLRIELRLPVTGSLPRRRHGCDAGDGRWNPIVRYEDPAMKRPISIVLALALVVGLAACGASTGGLGSVPSVVPTPPAAIRRPDEPDLTPPASTRRRRPLPASAGPDADARPRPRAHGRARQDDDRPRLLRRSAASRGSRVSCRSCGPCRKPPAWPGPR